MRKISILIFIVIIGIISFPLIDKNSATQKENKDNIHKVSLLEKSADPSIVFIKKGESVRFDSKDGKSHILSSGSGNEIGDNSHIHYKQGINSPLFNSDEGYLIKFKNKGNYKFHDHNNPKIYITVVVYEPSNL